MPHEPQLPGIINMIFGKLVLTYGQRFNALYAGQPADEVRQHWAQELAGVDIRAITYALLNLPASPHAPNVLEFKALCQQYGRVPREPVKALPTPQVSPERVAATVGRLRGLGEAMQHGPKDPKAWARKLKEAEANGKRLTRFQCVAWRQVLGGS